MPNPIGDEQAPDSMDKAEQLKQAALDYHRADPPGKIRVAPTNALVSQRDLSLAYSPGVAAACEAIVEDANAASDADLWLAYDLLEAARLWGRKDYAVRGQALLARIENEEIADLPGLGKMLLPGPMGFTLPGGISRLNASYLPPPVLRRLAMAGRTAVWHDVARNTPAVTNAGIATSTLVYAGTGCTAAMYPATLPTGSWIAVVDGGTAAAQCPYLTRMQVAEAAGAAALVVAHNANGAAPILTGSMTAASPTIPAVAITQADGTATNGGPKSYPSVFYGCHYTNCSPGTNLPAQLSSISSAPTSVSFSYVDNAVYDAAYDIWLDPTPRKDGVNKTEIMVWYHQTSPVQPIGSRVATTNIGSPCTVTGLISRIAASTTIHAEIASKATPLTKAANTCTRS